MNIIKYISIVSFSLFIFLFSSSLTKVYAQSCEVPGSLCGTQVITEGSCIDGDPGDSCNTSGTQTNTVVISTCSEAGVCLPGSPTEEVVSCSLTIDRSACLDQQERDQPNPGRLRFAIPFENEEDVVAERDVITTIDSEFSFIRTVKTFNEGLWIVIIVSTMIVLIYAGFLLLTSFGKPEKLKTANNTLFYAGIGIGIALFSYIIINLIVNFF